MRWLLLALMGCGPPPEEASEYALEVTRFLEADAAGDPLGLGFEIVRLRSGTVVDVCEAPDDPWCGVTVEDAAPLLLRPDGRVVEAEAWLTADDRFVDFILPMDAQPGRWTVAGVAGFDLPMRSTVQFDVEDWGSAEPFEPTGFEGQWAVVEWHSRPIDLQGVVEENADVPPVFVQVDDSTAEGAQLRVIAQAAEGACILLQAPARWEGSELVYEEDRLAVEHPELGEVVAEDVRVSLAWSSQGPDVVRGTTDALVDTFALDAVVEDAEPGDGSVCQLLEAIGGVCEDCADGSPDCVGVHLYRIGLRDDATALGADLPLCGVDAFGEVPTLSCDVPDLSFDCSGVGCSQAGRAYGWFGLWLIPWLMRRRVS